MSISVSPLTSVVLSRLLLESQQMSSSDGPLRRVAQALIETSSKWLSSENAGQLWSKGCECQALMLGQCRIVQALVPKGPKTSN